ncbi:MAG: lycopene cyclase domain-containing protein [Actinomycetales bacterium]
MADLPMYTLGCLIAVPAVLVLDLWVARTRLVTTLQFWLAMGICLGFQVLVDGWLTKLSDPIVLYNPDEMSGLRMPWDIPVEDFAFGFAMMTLTLVVWRLLTRPKASAPPGTNRPDGPARIVPQ